MSGVTLAADQLTKHLVAAAFHPGESLPLVPRVLHVTYIQNTGAAFGLLKGQQLLFIGLSLLVIAWIARQFLAKRSPAGPMVWAYALVLGGAAGNLIDRLRLGYVVDFIDVRVWPVFNIGDSAITIGIALLIWRALRQRKVPGTS